MAKRTSQNVKTKTDPKDIYELFDQFLTKTIIEKKNFFSSDDDPIFNNDALQKLVEICKNLSPGFKTDDINNAVRETTNDKVKKVYGHILWLQNLPVEDTSKSTIINEINYITQLNTKYSKKGLARYGRANRQKARDIEDLILLFNLLLTKCTAGQLLDVKKIIIYWCLNLTQNGNIPVINQTQGIRSDAYENVDDCPSELLSIHNMLLHLCKKEHYDNISVSAHKKRIVKTFKELIPEAPPQQVNNIVDDSENYNRNYYIILNELYKMEHKDSLDYKDLWGKQGIGDEIRIYDSKYKNLWYVGSDYDDSDINALKFKKAIILYGPPGTSKTYSAKVLARNLIFQKDYKEKSGKGVIKEYLDKTEEDFKLQIHRLQLHPNWTYEDFIWGYQIETVVYKENKKVVCVGNKTVARKGYFLKLLDTIKEEKTKKTHVLILDEINRVDLSRLFGELFSAIENRNESVVLPVTVEGIDRISVPDNLYIIGTMNEIDFSLERVDFALRRRFAWFFYGYNEDTLASILKDKIENPIFDNNALAEYVQDCTNLNKEIDKDPDLGPQYQIGHTFFAELVDIWEEMPTKEIKSVKTILWNISIGPMIKAYLGNCDKETKDDKIKVFRKAFGINEK